MKNRREGNRLGLTVGVKLGKAVVRNRIRRRLSESYRLTEESLLSGYDIVIAARAASVSAEYRVLNRDICYCLKKLGLLKNSQ